MAVVIDMITSGAYSDTGTVPAQELHIDPVGRVAAPAPPAPPDLSHELPGAAARIEDI